MTKLNLYGNKFWDWRGWQVLKWVTGLVLIVGIICIIWTEKTSGSGSMDKKLIKFLHKNRPQ